jgi:hypothetical protein
MPRECLRTARISLAVFPTVLVGRASLRRGSCRLTAAGSSLGGRTRIRPGVVDGGARGPYVARTARLRGERR